MNKEIIHKIKVVLESEIGGLQTSIQKVTDMYGRLGGEIEGIGHKIQDIITKTPQGAQQFGVGTLTSQAGVVSGIGGAGGVGMGKPFEYAAASLEKLSKVAASVAKDLEDVKNKQLSVISSMADASDTQKKVALQDLNQLQGRERELMNLKGLLSGLERGDGAKKGGFGSIFGALMGSLTAAGIVSATSFLLGAPMARMQAKGAFGGLAARDTAAAGGFELEDIMRLDPTTREEAYSTGYQSRKGQSQAIWAGAAGAVGGFAGAKIGGAIGTGIAPGIGTVAGILIGGAIGFIANEVLGAGEKAGIGGYEEYINLAIEKMGGRGTAIRQAQRFTGTASNIQFAYGLGRGTEEGIAGKLRRAAILTSQDPDELAKTSVAMGGYGYGANESMDVATRLGRVGTKVGLSATMMARSAMGFMGMGTREEDVDKTIDIIAKGTKLGVNNSELMKQYLTSTAEMMRSFGGGVGGTGSEIAAQLMESMVASRGPNALAIGGAGALRSFTESLMGNREGQTGYLNIVGSSRALGKAFEKFPGLKGFAGANPANKLLLLDAFAGNPQVLSNLLNGMTDEQLSSEMGMARADIPQLLTLARDEKLGAQIEGGTIGRLYRRELAGLGVKGSKLSATGKLGMYGIGRTTAGVSDVQAARQMGDVEQWAKTPYEEIPRDKEWEDKEAAYKETIRAKEVVASAVANLGLVTKGLSDLRDAVDKRTIDFIDKLVELIYSMKEGEMPSASKLQERTGFGKKPTRSYHQNSINAIEGTYIKGTHYY